jgi:hypothetical protein
LSSQVASQKFRCVGARGGAAEPEEAFDVPSFEPVQAAPEGYGDTDDAGAIEAFARAHIFDDDDSLIFCWCYGDVIHEALMLGAQLGVPDTSESDDDIPLPDEPPSFDDNDDDDGVPDYSAGVIPAAPHL